MSYRTPIYLDPALVPATLRGSYNGKMFKAIVCEHMTIPSDAGLWSGGSRDVFSLVLLENGHQQRIAGQNSAPWDNSRRDVPVTLEPGFAIVCHTIFRGKDLGLTFYLHPDNAAKLLPKPVELDVVQRLVLKATASFKSSYGGQDRYQMAQGCYDFKRLLNGAGFPSRETWNAVKAELISQGFLNKAGAITNAGRNAIR